MFLFLFLLFLLSEAASDSDVKPVVVQAKPGDDVTLPCQTTETNIIVVKWTRDDLEPSEYVLFYRDGLTDTTYQHESYKGRVELVDSQLKTGDVSLNLNNVRISDSGTYRCRVVSGASGRQKAIGDTEPIRVVRLEITDSDVKPVVVQGKPGDDVTLQCNTTKANIRAMKWTRDDLESPVYVLFYRNGHPDDKRQHPSYKGRVELVDSQLKTGNVSLNLNNVRISDSGTYRCRVVSGGSGRQKRAAAIDSKPIGVVRLEITGSDSQKGDNMHGDQTSNDPEDGHQTRGHAVPVAGVLVLVGLAAVGMFLWRRKRHEAVRTSEPPDV